MAVVSSSDDWVRTRDSRVPTLRLNHSARPLGHRYLEKIKNVEHRKFFVKLRTGNNCLFLEKGRYQSLSREQRFCHLCNTEVENLEHFMFKCPELNVQRKSFLSKLYRFTGENFRLEPFNSQLKKIFTLNFKKDNDTITNIISKGIFDMYKAREKLESTRLKDN